MADFNLIIAAFINSPILMLPAAGVLAAMIYIGVLDVRYKSANKDQQVADPV